MQELKFFLLLLHNTPGIRDKVLYKILKAIYYEGITPSRFLELPYDVYRKRFKLSHDASIALSENLADHLERSYRLMEVLDNLGFRIVSVFDSDYPESVKKFFDFPPPILYMRGDKTLLKKSTFTILNSRDVDERCVEISRKFLSGEVLVSGVYGPGYSYALDFRGPKLGVSDRGVMQISGGRMAKFDAIVAFSGVDDMGTPSSMRLRDRVVASLSRRIIAGCIREGGNMFDLIMESERKGKEICIIDLERDGNRDLIQRGLNPCKIVDFA